MPTFVEVWDPAVERYVPTTIRWCSGCRTRTDVQLQDGRDAWTCVVNQHETTGLDASRAGHR